MGVLVGGLSQLHGIIGKLGGVTLPLDLPLSMQPFLSPPLSNEKKGRRAREVLTPHRWFELWAKKLRRTERRISGSGSVNVGDRGIWGLKPSLSAFA